MIEITVTTPNRQVAIKNATDIQWSTHYGEDGGGFGYLKFSVPYDVDFGHEHIGFGYEVAVYKHFGEVLHHGQIRQIDETSSQDGTSMLSVTSIGWSILASDDEFLRAFCDTRLNLWRPPSEVPSGLYRPDQFATGSNATGLYLNATSQEVDVNARTETHYTFYKGETARRLKADLSINLGTGILFDGQVSSIDSGNNYVFYKNDSGEARVQPNMVLVNLTQNVSSPIAAIDTGLNRVTTSTSISTWAVDDELTVYGPLFSAQISSIAAAIVTYTNDLGEGNLTNGDVVFNITQKSTATIQSFDTVGNTITFTNEDHLTGWAANDTLMVGAAIFEATFSSAASTTITYTSPIGERIASGATGWVLHNVTQNDVATVGSWTAASDQLDVTDAADISGWATSDVLRIYSAYTLIIRDDLENTLWPGADWREGAVPQDRLAVDITTVGSPTGFRVKWACYLGGSGNESSFAQLANLRVYSTTEDTTPGFLAKEAVNVLSATGHGLAYDYSYIDEFYPRILEPMIFEFKPIKDALTEVSGAGDENLNPIAWGVRLDNTKTLYMERQDIAETIDYVLKRAGPAEISMTGDIDESAQKVRAVYTDKLGNQQVTDWVEDTSAWFSGHYRAVTLRIDNADTEAEALNLVNKYLAENKGAKTSSSYQAQDGAIFNPYSIPVPFDEVKAKGGWMEVEDWRAAEATGVGATLGSKWVREKIAAVEVNYDDRSVSIIPGSAKATFEKYMAELARLARTG